jgi:putative ABC transport system ATP-binding protein
MPWIFETKAVCKYYRAVSRVEVRAVHDVSLSVPRGGLTIVHGPSGSGKTTLLAMLGGLDRPTRGQVIFDGRDLRACSDNELARCRARMGFIFQDFALIPSLTAVENITYPLIPRSVPRAERLRRAHEWLARFDLADRAGRRARELSGGEQQRVAIARAFAGHPEVVLADEPTSNLDPQAASVVLDTLRELQTEGGTVIAATHDDKLLAAATSTYLLAAGRLVT